MRRQKTTLVLFGCITLCVVLATASWISRALAHDSPDSDGSVEARPVARPQPLSTPTERVLAHPLFSRTREPVSENAPVAASDAPPTALALLGITAVAGGRRLALLQNPETKERRLVREGDSLSRWSIVEVQAKLVRLRYGNTEVEAALNYSPTSPPLNEQTPP